MSNRWKVKIKSSAKGDLKKVLRSPLRQSFEEIKNVAVNLIPGKASGLACVINKNLVKITPDIHIIDIGGYFNKVF